jgi:hypothetical protein
MVSTRREAARARGDAEEEETSGSEDGGQESVKKRYEEIDALFNKYDAQVNATRLAKPKEGVRVLPFKEIKRRVEKAFPGIVKKSRNSLCTSTCTPSSSHATT